MGSVQHPAPAPTASKARDQHPPIFSAQQRSLQSISFFCLGLRFPVRRPTLSQMPISRATQRLAEKRWHSSQAPPSVASGRQPCPSRAVGAAGRHSSCTGPSWLRSHTGLLAAQKVVETGNCSTGVHSRPAQVRSSSRNPLPTPGLDAQRQASNIGKSPSFNRRSVAGGLRDKIRCSPAIQQDSRRNCT